MGDELTASHTGPCSRELKAAPRILQKLPQSPQAKRRQGYSLIVDEMEEGLSAMAAPIIDAGGRTIAAMNIAFNTGAVKRQELLNTILPQLRQAVARLNGMLSQNMVKADLIKSLFLLNYL
jgi:DNA-binding IclR family transcriptional regulator